MKRLAIGIDIGGINTSMSLVDRAGDVYAESGFRTSEYPYFEDYSAYVKKLAASLQELCEAIPSGAQLEGIGIGAPNANFYSGRMEWPVNLWKFRPEEPNPDDKRRIFPLCDDLEAYFPDVAIRMTNDANTAALGEMIYGNARGMRDFIMVTLGTGLGSGFVSNGQMIYGHDGRRGCLETYVSATGIKRTAFELMARDRTPSVLRKVAFDRFDSKMITEAAEQGDALAIEVFDLTARRLARALADAVAITSPEAIILFGGLAQAGDLLLEPTRRYLEEYLLSTYRGKVKVLLSAMDGNSAAVMGAAALIWE